MTKSAYDNILEGLTETESSRRSLHQMQGEPDLDTGMQRVTDVEGRTHGYVTAVKTGEIHDVYPTAGPLLAKEKIEEIVENILDVFEDITEAEDNLVVRGNLLDSMNSLVDELWMFRKAREADFKKYIVLIQSIIRGEKLDNVSLEKIEDLRPIFQTLKNPCLLIPILDAI